MKKLSRLLIISGSTILIYLAGLFGTSTLNNYHLKYLRTLGNNVVMIHTLNGAGATGFIVKGKSGKRYVMTNNHVCGLEEYGTILADFQGDTYVTGVVKRYPLNDLCVMSAPGTASDSFKIAKSYSLGEAVYSIGHPQLEPLSISVGELSDEIIVHVVVKVNGPEAECHGDTYTYHKDDLPIMMQVFGTYSICERSLPANTSSVVILPGNSGSPTVNIWGEVVAVAFAANESGTRSYHVPLASLRDFLSGL
jgi:S1-C subfamily serine protease